MDKQDKSRNEQIDIWTSECQRGFMTLSQLIDKLQSIDDFVEDFRLIGYNGVLVRVTVKGHEPSAKKVAREISAKLLGDNIYSQAYTTT